MAKGIKELRGRIRSIKNTRKITRAMEMVSAAKLRRTQQVMEGSKPFLDKLRLLLGRLALSPKALEHPIFEVRAEQGATLVLLFTSDRGLCGAFNTNLLKAAERLVRDTPDIDFYCVGRKGYEHVRKYHPSRLVGHRIDLGNQLDGEMTNALANYAERTFLDGKYNRVLLLAPEFVSTAYNRPHVSQYLPMEPKAFGLTEEEAETPIDYILEPSPEAVFEALLPRYLETVVYLALAETYTAEHASRMVAMNSATKNCDELSGKLTLQMNKARQEAITTEILEIVSGAEALNG